MVRMATGFASNQDKRVSPDGAGRKSSANLAA